MPPTPPSGALAAPPQTEPPTTRHQAVPIDAREWRIRTEQRANAMLMVALALLVGAYAARAAWIGVGSLVLGLAILVASLWLRPALPWRAPSRRQVDDADLAVMRPAAVAVPMPPPHPGSPQWGPPYPVTPAHPTRIEQPRVAGQAR